MKKNYLSKTAMSANPLALIVAKKSWQNTATTWLLLLFTVFGFTDAFGQVANYTFSESAGTYTTIAGTTAIASGWDDTVTANTIPIGFTFNFNGTNYTTCSINSNGYITFGATTSANNLFTPISNNTGYAGAISGFGVDLRDNNTRDIIYTTTGTAPNRVFTVQWREARRFAEAGNLDFQIKLFETSNRIDIVYANFALNNKNVNVQVGLRGANNTDFNNRSLTTTNTAWNLNTTAGGVNNATCRSRDNNQPSNGRTFTWTPPTPPTITSLGAASGCVGSTLTINGTNLLTATAVTIGGTAATITGTTATSVTVTVGTGTTGTVQVTTPGGTATSAATFTVNPLPAAIGGGAATVCTGVSTPAFTNATPGGTWSVIPAGGTASITAGGILTGTTAGNVRVRYTLPSGCFIETANIAVQQTPGAITGGAATVCVGSSTPAFTNPNGGGTWSVLNGSGAATITSPGGILTGTSAGSVTVRYTIGSCTPATYNVTVNPAPAAIAGGATTVCVGGTTPAFTNAVGGGTWSITNGTGSATISGSGVVTGVTTGTATVVYSIGTCTVSTPITVISTPTISANPANLSLSTGGTGSFTVTALNGPTSYTWQVSTNGGATWTTVTNGGVYSGATTATLTITGATIGMNGYLYHASATNACGTSAYSTAATLTVSNIVLVTGLGVNNVNCGENAILRDHNNTFNYGNNRDDWSALNVTSTAVVNINGTYDTENGADGIWLYDGVGIGGTLLAVYTGVGTINYTGNPGQTITIRFTSDFSATRPGFDLNVTYSGNCNIPCVAPTALPTALSLTATGTVISGSFTHATPRPDNYLVVISTNPVAPSPANGTSYAVGATVGAGYTVIANGSGNSFSATGLANTTTYYVYVFSFNRLCIGGPLYLGNLNGNITTTGSDPYCIPSSNVSTRYIENIFTVGAITNLNNMGTGRATGGYADYTASTPVTQIPGGGVAIDYLLRVSRQYISMWVDWNNDGDFTDPGEAVYTSGGVQTIEGTGGFVVPAAQPLGTYRIRIRTREGSPTISPCTSPYTTGETEDYRLVVVADCLAKPVTLYDGSRCDNGTVVLGVEGSAGVTQFRFYDSLYGGNLIGTQAAVPGVTNWTTPFLTATTKYYVTAFNGTCESWFREEIIATVNPTANIVVTPSVPEVCGENNVVQIDAGGDEVIDYLVNEEFEGGLGTMTQVTPNGDANTRWTGRVSPYVPTGTVWKPAITSRAIGNGFALANSDFAAPNPKDTQLRTAALDASAYSNLTLSFRHHFSYYPGEPVQFGYIDVSTNGGTTWPTTIATYASNQGFAGQFATVNVDLSAFAGQPNLMVRFRYSLGGGSAWANGWAIDDVQLYGTRPLNTTFTWTGGTVAAFIDPACTIPYVAQSVTTIYVRPTPLQLASPSWSFTANATLGNLCPISQLITINNKTKLWKGTVDNNWYNPNNWSPTGVPDANTCVYIYPGSPAANTSNINTIANDAFAKVVTVRPSGVLNIHPNNDLTVTDAVTVDAGGTFNIENNGSLVQINNVTNTGNIVYKRTAPSIRGFDYVYWSSPVVNQNIGTIYTSPVSGLKYQWNPTVANGNGGQGNWETASGNMLRAKGYIVRGSSNYGMPATNIDATFTGVPHNGNIPFTISRGSYTGAPYNGTNGIQITNINDNYNLIGNPYPSAIDAEEFLAANTYHATTNPTGVIYGNVKLWTHGYQPAAIVNPFYGSFAYNYNANDYVTLNYLGASDPIGASNIIKSGQAFLVQMIDGTAGSGTINFSNGMRLDASNNSYNNSGFFRTSTNEFEKHRIWLDLIDSNNIASGTLVGYATDATYGFDTFFDAQAAVPAFMKIYSLIGNDVYDIQGRSLPFDQNDQVPLGATFVEAGNYTIALNTIDGLFLDSNQNIYLEDKDLNITHNLKVSPYNFTTSLGTFHNRFVLKFNNETLGNEDFIANNVTVYTNESINISAPNQVIKSVRVHDLLGRVLGTFNNVNSNTYSSKNIAKTQSPLLVEVTLENGATKTYKVIF